MKAILKICSLSMVVAALVVCGSLSVSADGFMPQDVSKLPREKSAASATQKSQAVQNLRHQRKFIPKIIGGSMLVRKEPGRVINVASMSGMIANRGIGGRCYETSKAAVIQFTKATAADWAPRAVTVNAICPGGFMTAPNQRWSKENPEVIESFNAQIPMGKFGEPEDLGPLAVYLASDASRYMTGAALLIDGGYTLW